MMVFYYHASAGKLGTGFEKLADYEKCFFYAPLPKCYAVFSKNIHEAACFSLGQSGDKSSKFSNLL